MTHSRAAASRHNPGTAIFSILINTPVTLACSHKPHLDNNKPQVPWLLCINTRQLGQGSTHATMACSLTIKALNNSLLHGQCWQHCSVAHSGAGVLEAPMLGQTKTHPACQVTACIILQYLGSFLVMVNTMLPTEYVTELILFFVWVCT